MMVEGRVPVFSRLAPLLFALLLSTEFVAAQTSPIGDQFFFGVRLSGNNATRPTDAALEAMLSPIVANSTAHVFVRDPSRPGAKWQYEFAFVGATAAAYFDAFVNLTPFAEAALLHADHVSAILPPDEFFFAVWLANNTAALPSVATLVSTLQALVPTLPPPEVFARQPAQGTAQWNYEFAFLGPNASSYMAAFVTLSPAAEARILNASIVTGLVPPDGFFFAVRNGMGGKIPTDVVLSAELRKKLMPANSTLPAPEIYMRAPRQTSAKWNYEFAFVGPNGGAYMNAFISVGATLEAKYLNATTVTALVPLDEFFFAVRLAAPFKVPTDLQLSQMLLGVIPDNNVPPEIYLRSPAQGTAQWAYEFAFVGPFAGDYMSAFASLTPAAQAARISAIQVTPLVPGDEFFFAVWLRAGIAMPTDINVAGQLWRGLLPNSEPPEIYMRPTKMHSGNWSFEFAFVGPNGANFMAAFIQQTPAQEATLLNATAVSALLPYDSFFFAVRNAAGGAVPDDLFVSQRLAPLLPILPPPEIFLRPPSQSTGRWTYEFAFVGPNGGAFMEAYVALSPAQEANILSANQVTALVPGDEFFFAVRQAINVPAPSPLQLSFMLGQLQIAFDPPELYVRPASQITGRWDYEFAFVGPNGGLFMTSFVMLTPAQEALQINASFVSALQPPDTFFFAVFLKQGKEMPTPSALSATLNALVPTASAPELYFRLPQSSSWSYEFAFVGPDGGVFMTALINNPAGNTATILNATSVTSLVPSDEYFFQVRLIGGSHQPSNAALSAALARLDSNTSPPPSMNGAGPAVYLRAPTTRGANWNYEFAFIGPNSAYWMQAMVAAAPAGVNRLLNASYVGAVIPPDAYFFQARLRFGAHVPSVAALEWSLTQALNVTAEIYARPPTPGSRWAYEFAFVGPTAATAFAVYVSLTPAQEAIAVNASFVGPIVPTLGFFGVTLKPNFATPGSAAIETAIQSLVTGDLYNLPEVYVTAEPSVTVEGFAYAFACVGPDAGWCHDLVANAAPAKVDAAFNATAVTALDHPVTQPPTPSPTPPPPPHKGDTTGTTIAVVVVVTLIVGAAAVALGIFWRRKRAVRRRGLTNLDANQTQYSESEASSVRASYGYGAYA